MEAGGRYSPRSSSAKPFLCIRSCQLQDLDVLSLENHRKSPMHPQILLPLMLCCYASKKPKSLQCLGPQETPAPRLLRRLDFTKRHNKASHKVQSSPRGGDRRSSTGPERTGPPQSGPGEKTQSRWLKWVGRLRVWYPQEVLQNAKNDG